MSKASVALPEACTITRWNGLVHAFETALESDEVVLREPRRSHRGGNGLEDSSYLVYLEQCRAGEEVAHEAHSGQEEIGVEAGDVRAVADAGVEHADEGQRPYRLPERVARQPELPCEILFTGELGAGLELAGDDQLLDLRDRLVG